MKYIQIFFCTAVIAFLGIIGICTLDNRTPSSEDEMRSYTMFPELDYSRMTDVEYLNQIGDAFTDQMEWRWNFVKGYFTLTKDVLHQSSVGDIIIGKEEVLFNKPLNVKSWKKYQSKLAEATEEINKVAREAYEKYGTKFIVVDIPRRDIALTNYTPSYYPDLSDKYDECLQVQIDTLDDSIQVIDAKSLFNENNPEGDNRFWYYNDHHINCRGGELILSEIIKIVQEDYPQVEQKTLEDYTIVKRQVYGALNRKIGLTAKAPDEELNLIPDGWSVNYERWDEGERTDRAIFDPEANTYSRSYMGDNFGETIVKTDNGEDLPSIYYCGSSFTNVLEAMSVPSFQNMYSTDMRFNNTEYTMMDYIDKFQPEYVVFISGQSTATFKGSHIMTHLGLDKNSAELD